MYAVIDGNRQITPLADASVSPDLACHTRQEATKLDANIRVSETIEGDITPKWDSTVICGFVRDT